MATFVDRVVLHLQAGDGGQGWCSVRGEKFKPLGGPDGGNGGHGGGITLVVDPQQHTLLDFPFPPHIKGGNGGGGAGANRDGANGKNLVLEVPDGTVVQTLDGEVLADLIGAGSSFEVARGRRRRQLRGGPRRPRRAGQRVAGQHAAQGARFRRARRARRPARRGARAE